MPMTAPRTMLDPLHAFQAGAFLRGSRLPVPLLATRFEVSLDAGLATVVTRRVFRNAEAESIEATITFPVPVQATLFELTARIDGRLLRASAQARAGARATYETAIERGKAAVLHEEVLRGVHMLSVAHIAPGAEIEVAASWAMPLDGRGRLRIPLTVGDIYGRSPLPDSDDLVHGGPGGSAELAVRCGSGTVALAGGTLDDGRASVPLNAPIELAVSGWTPRELRGRAADGREVLLRIEPLGGGEAKLALAMLIDRSGSMQEACSGNRLGTSKHRAVANGLAQVAHALREGDRVDVWQFDDGLEAVGASADLPSFPATPADRLRALAQKLRTPRGGTEIGAALTGVVGQSEARDIVLVTDGKSHALDVQALARSGRRFSVVLVGEDSLEANVGHLAGATGGEIVVVGGDDVADALAACLAALRHPGDMPAPVVGELRTLELRRNGQRIRAEWRGLAQPVEDGPLARAVAAVAAGLAIPVLEPAAATALAAAEGLVTHLTSLVLVDEEGAVHQGQPASRSVALPTPRTALASPPLGAMYDSHFEERMPCAAPMPAPPAPYPAQSPTRRRAQWPKIGGAPPRPASAPAAPAAPAEAARPRRSGISLAPIGREIAWALAPNRLRAGDLGALQPHVAAAIRAAATDPEVAALAARLRLDPVVLVLALLARGSSDRSAARFARSVLGERPPPQIRALAGHLGLGKGASMLGWLRSRGGDDEERPLR